MMCCFFGKLRDWIFPAREKDLEDPKILSLRGIASQVAKETDDKKLKMMYEVISQIATSERERDESIVRRSTSFLGAVSILSALTLGFGLSNLTKPVSLSVLAYAFLSILYICIMCCFSVSVLSALKAMETKTFYVIGAKEAVKVKATTELEYLRGLLVKLVEYTEKNYRVTNNRVTRYADSWRYLQWGIFLLFIFGLFSILFSEYVI